jgi:hypothetical protein
MRMWRRAASLVLALTAAACLPVTTKTPIGTTAGLVADPELEGLWIGRSTEGDKTVSYFHFISTGANGFTLVGVTPRQGKDNASWGVYHLTTATLGGNRYMNANEVSDDEKPAPPEKQQVNIPLLYTMTGDTLTISLLDEDKMKAAIDAHRIAGEIHKSYYGKMEIDDVEITADAAHLDAFFAKPDAAGLFKPLLTLKRPKVDSAFP